MPDSAISPPISPLRRMRSFVGMWVKPDRTTYGGLDRVRAAHFLDRVASEIGYSKNILVVSGFWRSGTTWLQEYLGRAFRAKTLFEPLSPAIPRRDEMLEAIEGGSYDFRQALIPGLLTKDDEMWIYLDNVLSGKEDDFFLLACRRNLIECFRSNVIMKMSGCK